MADDTDDDKPWFQSVMDRLHGRVETSVISRRAKVAAGLLLVAWVFSRKRR